MNTAQTGFDHIAVVLVSPAGLRNIGATARAMKNCGFEDLVLVAPPDFHCRETYDMAPHSHDILDRARTYETLPEALADRNLALGITARTRYKTPRLAPEQAVEICRRHDPARSRIALVFGPEDHGLSNSHLALCQHLVGIPTHPDLASLNLSQAVLLLCHAFFRSLEPRLCDDVEERRELSPIDDKLRIEAALCELLIEAGYLSPAREIPLRQTIKRLVFGREIETRDTRNVLAGIRHLRYVLERGRPRS